MQEPIFDYSQVADSTETAQRFIRYMRSQSHEPLFLLGDALEVLRLLPAKSIDCCMTSPPYWGKRQYANGGIGFEKTSSLYIDALYEIICEVHRVLKDTGSFWLNLGDTYVDKCAQNIPWRVAIRMTDNHEWILRNTVIWNKVKGAPDNTKDRLRCIYEPVFHFVKNKAYYYDIDSIRHAPQSAKIVNGAVVSATGVSGIRYKRKIELSTELSDEQKHNAMLELNAILHEVETGALSDFRMIIKGQQRTTHSDSEKVSGRAKELHDKGYYFLRYNPNGSKPSDIWDILPEDTQGREGHFAAYPEDLCKDPISLTCPPNGIVLDPFAGTGTTMLVARQMERKSVGIDISPEYIHYAETRCRCE